MNQSYDEKLELIPMMIVDIGSKFTSWVNRNPSDIRILKINKLSGELKNKISNWIGDKPNNKELNEIFSHFEKMRELSEELSIK